MAADAGEVCERKSKEALEEEKWGCIGQNSG